jgi:hypothetical protein
MDAVLCARRGNHEMASVSNVLVWSWLALGSWSLYRIAPCWVSDCDRAV